MKRIIALSILLLLSVAFGDILVMKEDFSGTIKQLKDAGWSTGSYATSAEGCLKITAGKTRRFITLDVPVEKGVMYSGSIMVKALDVMQHANNERGATLFYGFLSEKKEWVNGGEFPRGAYRSSGWTKVKIGTTVPIPENVKYIQIWIGVEGEGSALFKDFIMEKIEMNLTIQALSTNPPSFKLPQIPDTSGVRKQMRLIVSLSRKPDFPEDETFTYIAKPAEIVTFPHAVKTGKWYAKGVFIARTTYNEMLDTVEIKTLPDNFIPKITPDFPNGRYNEKPVMTLTFYPPLSSAPKLSCKGAELQILENTPGQLKFTTREKLSHGVHYIICNANGHESKHILVNKDPAFNYSLRDDNMLLIDGKPFFPVGTYRDPSDTRDDFSGIHEAGFNVTHSYDFEHKVMPLTERQAYLKDCVNNKVMTFLGIPRSLLTSEKTDELMEYCAETYGEKGLLTYYLADEPTMWINRHSFKLGADAVKKACPGIPRTLLMCTLGSKDPIIRFFGNGLSEIHWFDSYPIPRAHIKTVKTDMEEAKRALSTPQSFWAVIQAFDWEQQKVRNMKPEEVEPKAGKIRCMTHLALAANVQGIIFYWLPKDRYDMKIHSPIQWAEVCSTTKELNSLMPFLVGRNAPQKFSLPKDVEYWCRRSEDGKYALGLINTSDKYCSFNLNFMGQNVNISLPPYGVEIFKQ